MLILALNYIILRKPLLISLLKNWDLEKLCKLSKFTQLASGRARFRKQAVSLALPGSCFFNSLLAGVWGTMTDPSFASYVFCRPKVHSCLSISVGDWSQDPQGYQQLGMLKFLVWNGKESAYNLRHILLWILNHLDFTYNTCCCSCFSRVWLCEIP